MAGLAPKAKRVFAIKSIDTKLVIHWINGEEVFTEDIVSHARTAESAFAVNIFANSTRFKHT